MFEFRTGSRSAWKKSLQVAVQRVIAGKLSREEFVAAAVPSPCPRDPDPLQKLDSALAADEESRRQAAEAEVKRAAEAKERAAKIESLRNLRCWRLAGFYLEDISLARYTLTEIEAWVDWDACNLRVKNPDVTAEADGHDVSVNFSGRFAEVCGGRVPGFIDIEKACRRLAAYVADRREAAAPKN